MYIEIETESAEMRTYGMVTPGQLFVSKDGKLCQKGNADYNQEREDAWVICDEHGRPDGSNITFYDNEAILRILPAIRRINF